MLFDATSIVQDVMASSAANKAVSCTQTSMDSVQVYGYAIQFQFTTPIKHVPIIL